MNYQNSGEIIEKETESAGSLDGQFDETLGRKTDTACPLTESIPDTPTEWERYLRSYEAPLTEELFDYPERISDVSSDVNVWNQEDCSVSNEMLGELEKGFQKMTPNEREVIKLRYWRGYSQKQIAVHMGITRASIRTYLDRAHMKVKKGFSKEFLKKFI